MLRRASVLVLGLALIVTLPAAARPQDETVTLRIGQTVPLETVFDKTEKATIVMSGLITRTTTGLTYIFDPFYGNAANCQKAGPGVNLQIEDEAGRLIDFADAGRPRCRPDHRYEFVVNENYPRYWHLHGEAKAYIPGQVKTPGWTDSGSFTLQIKGGTSGRRDVRFTVEAKKELVTLNDPLLADVRLSGTGRMNDLDGASTARGLFHLTLVWLTREDTHLLLRPEGKWTYSKSAKMVSGGLRVTRSSDGSCLKGRAPNAISLLGRKRQAHVNMGLCAGFTFLRWREPKSEVEVSVKEVRAGG